MAWYLWITTIVCITPFLMLGGLFGILFLLALHDREAAFDAQERRDGLRDNE
jgi:hypothetical protein